MLHCAQDERIENISLRRSGLDALDRQRHRPAAGRPDAREDLCRTERVRAGFVALVDATLGGPVTGRQALAWRIDAKMAQARLLQLAQFGTDDRLRRQAKRSAWLYLSECESLLLG